jgi:hypothetical protein
MDNRDWEKVFKQFDSKRLEFSANKQHFTKVAFDVFTLNASPVDSLWILEEGEDGKQYLCATYEDQPITAQSDWTTATNKEASIVVLCYKNYPMHKFASTAYGFTKEDVHLFERSVLSKVASDPTFVKTIASLQNQDVKKQFPELA